MLFEDRFFQSKYDFDKEVKDEDASLYALTKEIERMQDVLLEAYKQKERVYFRIAEPYEHKLWIPFEDVKENTWYRSQAEIKEILYRKQDAQQFSINKALDAYGIHEPSDPYLYKEYLQILYFCYMMNYFAFPKTNVLKCLKLENSNYHFSFDEGSDEGIYTTMILTNLLCDEEVMDHMLFKQTSFDAMIHQVSMRIRHVNSVTSLKELNTWFDTTIQKCHEGVKPHSYDSLLIHFYDYIMQYSLYAYCSDLVDTLQQDDDWYDFDEIEYDPPISWMKLYVPFEKVDEFLESEECYQFCKQTRKKMEVRDKIKFMESNAVAFLKLMLDYDHRWMEDDGDEGLLITKRNGKEYIYALRLATMIQTYNEVIVKKKMCLFTGQKQQSLRTSVFYHKNEPQYAPLTLTIRFLLLAAYAQYLNITRDHYYTEFFKRHYIVEEIWNMKVILEGLRYTNLDDRNAYFACFLTYI